MKTHVLEKDNVDKRRVRIYLKDNAKNFTSHYTLEHIQVDVFFFCFMAISFFLLKFFWTSCWFHFWYTWSYKHWEDLALIKSITYR